MKCSLDYNPAMHSPPNIVLSSLRTSDRSWVISLLTDRWGEVRVVSRGRLHDASQLPGFVARIEDQVVGLVTYHIDDEACELVTLDSLVGGLGVGTALVQAVAEAAKKDSCRRLWSITTNDNLHAIHFYQKRGFHLVALYPNSLAYSRQLKPSIPVSGIDDIPLRDELEFELILSEAPAPLQLPDFPLKLDRHTLYTSNWVSLHADKILLPTGRIIDEFHVVDFPRQAVAALVSDQDGRLLFEQVYRYPTGRLEWEIPAGGIEPGEAVLDAAQREIREETGYVTTQARWLYTFHPANGNTNAVFHLMACQATDCVGGLDHTEIKSIRWFTKAEIEALIQTGELMDGFTLAAILFWWWFTSQF